jgi:hypothetical protein
MHYISPKEGMAAAGPILLASRLSAASAIRFIQTAFLAEFMAGDCRRPEARPRIFPPRRFPDGYLGIQLPVRKSLTKKSGIVGLPAGASQDSLVGGERG